MYIASSSINIFLTFAGAISGIIFNIFRRAHRVQPDWLFFRRDAIILRQ